MNDDSAKILGCFGSIVGFIALMVVGSLARGWALATTWGWFIAPYFGLPSLGIVQAIGIALVVSLLTYQGTETKDDNKDILEVLASLFARVIFVPLFFVGIGWIVVQFL